MLLPTFLLCVIHSSVWGWKLWSDLWKVFFSFNLATERQITPYRLNLIEHSSQEGPDSLVPEPLPTHWERKGESLDQLSDKQWKKGKKRGPEPSGDIKNTVLLYEQEVHLNLYQSIMPWNKWHRHWLTTIITHLLFVWVPVWGWSDLIKVEPCKKLKLFSSSSLQCVSVSCKNVCHFHKKIRACFLNISLWWGTVRRVAL